MTPLSQPVGVRELRNQIASVLRRAQNGERVLVTVDGRPVAQLGPIIPTSNQDVTLWDLAGAGLVEPPRRHDQPAAPKPQPIPADVRTERLLDHVRGRRP